MRGHTFVFFFFKRIELTRIECHQFLLEIVLFWWFNYQVTTVGCGQTRRFFSHVKTHKLSHKKWEFYKFSKGCSEISGLPLPNFAGLWGPFLLTSFQLIPMFFYTAHTEFTLDLDVDCEISHRTFSNYWILLSLNFSKKNLKSGSERWSCDGAKPSHLCCVRVKFAW